MSELCMQGGRWTTMEIDRKLNWNDSPQFVFFIPWNIQPHGFESIHYKASGQVYYVQPQTVRITDGYSEVDNSTTLYPRARTHFHTHL